MRARVRRASTDTPVADTIAARLGASLAGLVSTPVLLPPSVKVVDASGLPVPGVTVVFAVTGGGGSATGTTVLTNNAGIATVGSWTLGASAGTDNNTMTATATGLTGSPVSFAVSGSAVANPAAKLGLTTQPSSAPANGVLFPQQPAVQILDTLGVALAIPGIVVTVALVSGAGTLSGTTTATTDNTGLATFTNLTLTGVVGARTLGFTASGLVGITSTAVTVVAGAAATMAANSPTSQTAVVSTNVAFPPSVLVTDPSGNPVAGVNVTFTRSAPGSTLNTSDQPVVVATNASGIAALTTWKMGSAVATRVVNVTVTGLTGSPVAFSCSATASAADHLGLTSQPSSTVVNGVALAQVPVIQLLDSGNNAVSQSGVVVTVTIASGGAATLSTATAVTDGSGVATFTGLTLTGLIGTRTLQFTAPNLLGIISTGITLTTGAAATIAANSPTSQNATVSTDVASPPSVLVTDQSGNPVIGTTVTFAVTVGGGSRNPATVNTDASGIATLTSWTLGAVAGANTLTATAAGLSGSPVSFSATGTSAGGTAATQLTLTTQPSSAPVNGTAFVQQPAVQLRDVSGNAVSQASVVVTASILSGAGTLGGTLTAVTDGNGLATFADLKITGLVGVRTLSFAAAGLTSAVSGNVTLVASAATNIAANSATSQTVLVNGNVGAPPSVKVTDQSGNPVSGVTVTFTVTGGGGSSTPATVNTNASGIATLTSWTAGPNTGVNNNTLQAAA